MRYNPLLPPSLFSQIYAEGKLTDSKDLRVYTLWRAEWEHFTKQQLQFHKQNSEWELLGELALRLHHKAQKLSPF